MKKILILATLLVVSVAACGDDTTTGTKEPAPGPSVFDDWTLVDGPVPEAAIGATTLRITPDGAVNGTTACNSYGSEGVAVDGDRWLATGFFVTEMGCEPALMEAESQYLAVLGTMTGVAVSPTSLELSTSDGSSVLQFTRVIRPPDSELTGTTWVLESVIYGDAVTSTMGGGDDITLELASDGSVTGNDACGPMGGTYEVDGDRIRFDVTVDMGTMCGFAEQSADIESVLASDPTFAIDGPRLTLMTSAGTGLDYRARAG